MKKLLLSGFVVGLFIIYGLNRQEEMANTQVSVPQSSQQITPNTSITSNQGTAGNPTPTSAQASGSSNPPVQQGKYKDGTYTGSVADAFYGNIQVQAIISGGKIVNINFLQYPSDNGTSLSINQQADPMLAQEAIQIQAANVDIISGATDSSQAFIQSMQSALAQAQ